MSLQNRVDPFSKIQVRTERGLFMGNRGILHDHETRTLNRETWATDLWIICLLSFKGRKRTVMRKRSYTELFFLDEATALAAGHRPCFECRRQDANLYIDAICDHEGLSARPKAGDLNKRLTSEIKPHIRRSSPTARQIIDPSKLPDGAIYNVEDMPYLVYRQAAYPWTFAGYLEAQPLHETGTQLTPNTSLSALRGGYKPIYHPSLSEVIDP